MTLEVFPNQQNSVAASREIFVFVRFLGLGFFTSAGANSFLESPEEVQYERICWKRYFSCRNDPGVADMKKYFLMLLLNLADL